MQSPRTQKYRNGFDGPLIDDPINNPHLPMYIFIYMYVCMHLNFKNWVDVVIGDLARKRGAS